MGLRITLDNTLLSNTPIGWDSAKISSKRDLSIRGLLSTYTTELTFWGDGFDYLDSAITNSYCDTVSVLIETDDCNAGTFTEEFVGTIVLTKISSLNVTKRTIETRILDESFDAKIRNNKSLKAFVDVGVSKNAENIQAVTPVDIGVFDVDANFKTYIATSRKMWRVFDCFRFIIDYISDGQIDFKSDLLSGDYYNWMLCNGKELRLGNNLGDQLEVSFKELFTEIYKKTNISFSIEATPSGYSSQYQLRLENTSFFEEDDAVLTINDVSNIIMKFNKDELFSHVDIGSSDFDDNVVLSYPPLNFKAFKEENYTILGNCNVDKPLNLVSKWIIDTNIIEDVLAGSNTDKYDKKTYLIVTDGANCIKYKEYDDPVSEGVIDGVSPSSSLIDSTADFNADGVSVGDMAVNLINELTANIDSIDISGTLCSLDVDVFSNGDTYQIRTAPFNYNDPLTNIRVIERFSGGVPNSVIKRLSSSASNFQAGTTSEAVYSSFPSSTTVSFDDDSTPPFFDDGGNFSTINNDYNVPSSGLYGFRSVCVVKINGFVSNELIADSGFDTGNGWTISGLPGSSISSGEFSVNSTFTTNQLYLRRSTPLSSGNIYILNFDCTISKGSITVHHGQTVTESGSYEMHLDFADNQTLLPFLSFTFQNDTTFGQAVITIDNVSLKQTTRFDVTKTIRRSDAAGTMLQDFSSIESIVIQPNSFQQRKNLFFEKTFSAFTNERISTMIDIVEVSGNNTSFTLMVDDGLVGGNTTIFETVLTDDGGGDLLPQEESSFPIYNYKMKKAITFAEFKILKDSPEKAVLFSKGINNHIFGWRNNIEYNRKTGECEFDLRSKTKINTDC